MAKEIIDSVLAIAKDRNLENIKSVSLEIGTGTMPQGHHHEHIHDEHLDELDMENVRFGLGSISKNTILEKTEFKIIKIESDDWKITGIEV